MIPHIRYEIVGTATPLDEKTRAFNAISFALMTVAVKKIDVSVSYAIWSGVGTATPMNRSRKGLSRTLCITGMRSSPPASAPPAPAFEASTGI